MLAISDFDFKNLDKIIAGHGDSFGSFLIRFLNKVLTSKADATNKRILLESWPSYCIAIFRYQGWTEKEIQREFSFSGVKID